MELSFDTAEGGLLAVDSHRTVPAPFLTKTFHLVDDPATDDIVSWSEDGTTFVVWRPPEFAKDILPNYFKHNNFSSFVRQLNTYGFRKIVSDRWEFANEFFRKGHQDLLCEIHRRKTGQPNMTQPMRPGGGTASPTDELFWSHVAPVAASPRVVGSSHFTAAVSICDENERLRRDNCLLLSELARLRRLNDEVLLFLQNQVRLPLQDLSCIKWLKYNSLPALLPPMSSRFEEIVDDHVPAKVSTRPGTATTAVIPYVKDTAGPTLSFLDVGKIKDLSSASTTVPAAAESESCATKLFGVHLNGKKRSLSPSRGESRPKSPRTEVSLQLGTDPCWWKACKPVNEKIFI